MGRLFSGRALHSLAGLFFLCLPRSLPADPGARLSQWKLEARLRAPRLLAARKRIEAEVLRLSPSGGLPDPQVQVAYQLRSIETRVGPQRGTLSIQQALPSPGKRRLRRGLQEARVEFARAELRALESQLDAAVTRAYVEAWLTKERGDLNDEMVLLFEGSEEIARTLLASGKAPQEAVLQTQIELEVLRDRARQVRERLPSLWQDLRARVGSNRLDPPPSFSLAPPPRRDLVEGFLARLPAWLERAPALRTLNRRERQAAVEVSLERRRNQPELRLGLGWIPTQDARQAGVRGSGRDPILATLAFNLPLDRARNRALEEAKRREAEGFAHVSRQAELDLESRVRTWHFRFQDAVRREDLYRENLVPRARQSLEASFASFQAGLGTFPSLLEAERSLLEFEENRLRAFADQVLALAEIEAALGVPVAREIREEAR